MCVTMRSRKHYFVQPQNRRVIAAMPSLVSPMSNLASGTAALQRCIILCSVMHLGPGTTILGFFTYIRTFVQSLLSYKRCPARAKGWGLIATVASVSEGGKGASCPSFFFPPLLHHQPASTRTMGDNLEYLHIRLDAYLYWHLVRYKVVDRFWKCTACSV